MKGRCVRLVLGRRFLKALHLMPCCTLHLPEAREKTLWQSAGKLSCSCFLSLTRIQAEPTACTTVAAVGSHAGFCGGLSTQASLTINVWSDPSLLSTHLFSFTYHARNPAPNAWTLGGVDGPVGSREARGPPHRLHETSQTYKTRAAGPQKPAPCEAVTNILCGSALKLLGRPGHVANNCSSAPGGLSGGTPKMGVRFSSLRRGDSNQRHPPVSLQLCMEQAASPIKGGRCLRHWAWDKRVTAQCS